MTVKSKKKRSSKTSWLNNIVKKKISRKNKKNKMTMKKMTMKKMTKKKKTKLKVVGVMRKLSSTIYNRNMTK